MDGLDAEGKNTLLFSGCQVPPALPSSLLRLSEAGQTLINSEECVADGQTLQSELGSPHKRGSVQSIPPTFLRPHPVYLLRHSKWSSVCAHA